MMNDHQKESIIMNYFRSPFLFSGFLFFILFSVPAISKGADLTSQLIQASGDGNADVVKVLLGQGAKVDGRDGSEQTALKVACESGRLAVVKVLVEKGADVNGKSNSKGSPLNWDVGGNPPVPRTKYADRVEIAKILLDKKANVELPASNGDTALILAARNYKDSTMVKLLLEHGAKISAKNELGSNALIEAASANNLENLKLLIARGAKIDEPDADGDTALMNAVSKERIDSVKLLLEHGAKINAVNNHGQTALFRAAMDDDSHYDWGGDYVEVTKLLLAKGADINAKDDEGRTPLQAAIRNLHTSVEQILKDHGGH
jgi:ankyrin repeat protein